MFTTNYCEKIAINLKYAFWASLKNVKLCLYCFEWLKNRLIGPEKLIEDFYFKGASIIKHVGVGLRILFAVIIFNNKKMQKRLPGIKT